MNQNTGFKEDQIERMPEFYNNVDQDWATATDLIGIINSEHVRR